MSSLSAFNFLALALINRICYTRIIYLFCWKTIGKLCCAQPVDPEIACKIIQQPIAKKSDSRESRKLARAAEHLLFIRHVEKARAQRWAREGPFWVQNINKNFPNCLTTPNIKNFAYISIILTE
jgi:hypothetical protein